MRCISPITLQQVNPRNLDGKTIVPCGVCINCLQNRRLGWYIRLREHSKKYVCHFLTLTYSDENLTYAAVKPTLVRRDVQLFIKKLRKTTVNKLTYYLVGEYGTKSSRPHYHIILYNYDGDLYDKSLKCWNMGNVVVTLANERRLMYTTKYHINKGSYPTGCSPPFALMSKGIGLNYVEEFDKFHRGKLDKLYYQLYQFKEPLPRYYKQRLYSRNQLLDNVVDDKDPSIDRLISDHNEFSHINYFLYTEQQIREYSKTYKEKVTKSQTL